MYIFEFLTFYLGFFNQLNFFSGCMYLQAFFLLAIVAMITEKMSFSYFHGNLCQGKIPSSNHAAYQSKLSFKKWSQIDKTCTEENSSQRCILQLITKVRDPSTRVKMHQNLFFYFYYYLLSCTSKDLICCLTCLIFLKSS